MSTLEADMASVAISEDKKGGNKKAAATPEKPLEVACITIVVT